MREPSPPPVALHAPPPIEAMRSREVLVKSVFFSKFALLMKGIYVILDENEERMNLRLKTI